MRLPFLRLLLLAPPLRLAFERAGVRMSNMTPQELAEGILAVQTISQTVVCGIEGFRVECSCGQRFGTDTRERALAWCSQHGQKVHGGAA